MQFKLTTLLAVLLTTTTSIAQIPNYVPSNGLDGWWSFNGNSNDLSGNGNNGTINGAVLTADRNGNPNSAFAFNGFSSHISLSSPFFNGSTSVSEFTYFAEFKINELPGSGSEYSISTKEGYWRAISLIIFDDGSLRFTGSQPNPQGSFNVASLANTIVPNQWYCAVVTFQNSSLNLFINGQHISTSTVNYTTFDFSWVTAGNSTATNHFGAYESFSQGITRYFNGVLDNFGTWNRVLSLSERNSLCQNCQLNFITNPNSQNININNNAQFVVNSSDTNATYQWQTDLGLGFQHVSNAGQYSGANTDTLVVSNVTISNNNQQFRCIVNPGSCADTSDIAVLTVNNNVGIMETSPNNLISIFPNPTNDNFTIKGLDQLGNITAMELKDLNGKTVNVLDPKASEFNISELKPGVYFLTISAVEMQEVIKLVKE
jgi:hypothetical protein